MTVTKITVASGDGVGPEIMQAVLHIMSEAGSEIEIEKITIGQKQFESGCNAGIDEDAWQSLKRTKLLLKGPVITPAEGRFKSVDVTIGKSLGLYANIRPFKSYNPFIASMHPHTDVVVIRENEEDLYAGVEHRQTDEVMQCLKLISRPGCEKISRYAFEYARMNGRKKITCMTKGSIMKLTDGLFLRVFNEIADLYPDIDHEHIDIVEGAARVASRPTDFDVLIAPNMYGELLSMIGAAVTGSVALTAAASIGESCAVFEAVHGPQTELAGRDIANPSGLLNAAVMMLHHIGQHNAADRILNAWLATLEQGCHTADFVCGGSNATLLGTRAFADRVVSNLGKLPEELTPAHYPAGAYLLPPAAEVIRAVPDSKTLVGVDVFLQWLGSDVKLLAEKLQMANSNELQLVMITNRGVKVWPNGMPETFYTDHWRCRFITSGTDKTVSNCDLIALMERVDALGLDFIKCENLCNFDDIPGYALGQGQ